MHPSVTAEILKCAFMRPHRTGMKELSDYFYGFLVFKIR